jgi:hypothetical protein
MYKVKKYSISVVAVAGLLGLSWLSVASTSPAHAASTPADSAPQCKGWNDGVTFSATCDWGTYRARAQCTDGEILEWVNGPWVDAPASSYVYCSSRGGTYVPESGMAEIRQ